MKTWIVGFSLALATCSAFAATEYSCEGSDTVRVSGSQARVNIEGRATVADGRVRSFSGQVTGYPIRNRYSAAPSYPSYPPAPEYPSYPDNTRAAAGQAIEFSAGVDSQGYITFINANRNGRNIHFSKRSDLSNPEVARVYDAVARNLGAFARAAACCKDDSRAECRTPNTRAARAQERSTEQRRSPEQQHEQSHSGGSNR